MSNCKDCGTAMKALFTGEFCPNECDLPPERRTPLKTVTPGGGVSVGPGTITFKGAPTYGGGPFGGFVFWPTAPNPGAYQPKPDQCPKPYCRASGLAIHTSTTYDNIGGTTIHYSCSQCTNTWSQPLVPVSSQPDPDDAAVNCRVEYDGAGGGRASSGADIDSAERHRIASFHVAFDKIYERHYKSAAWVRPGVVEGRQKDASAPRPSGTRDNAAGAGSTYDRYLPRRVRGYCQFVDNEAGEGQRRPLHDWKGP